MGLAQASSAWRTVLVVEVDEPVVGLVASVF